MYYSNGNYEAFARPKKPENVENKSAYIVGSGLAAQDKDFGHPEKFCENIPDSNWTISATITFKDKRIAPYIENINHKDPYSGSIVTSGPTSIKDSNWLLGYSISRQPDFKAQKENELVVWLYALYTDRKGNYIEKRPDECSGKELCQEWLYHMGIPETDIKEIAEAASTIPCHMPYITTYFMPRGLKDRPLVVPEHSKNLAFIGNYGETPKETVSPIS